MFLKYDDESWGSSILRKAFWLTATVASTYYFFNCVGPTVTYQHKDDSLQKDITKVCERRFEDNNLDGELDRCERGLYGAFNKGVLTSSDLSDLANSDK